MSSSPRQPAAMQLDEIDIKLIEEYYSMEDRWHIYWMLNMCIEFLLKKKLVLKVSEVSWLRK